MNHPDLKGLNRVLMSLAESGLFSKIDSNYHFRRAKAERDHYMSESDDTDWHALTVEQVERQNLLAA